MENKKPNAQSNFFQNSNIKIVRVKSADLSNKANTTLSNKNGPKEYPSQKMKSDMRIYINQRSALNYSKIKINADLKTFGNVGKLYEKRSAYCDWVKSCVAELKGKYTYANEKYDARTGKLEITLLMDLEWKKPSDG